MTRVQSGVWFACSEQMPRTRSWFYLVHGPRREWDMALWTGKHWEWRSGGQASAEEITHWMTPMPPAEMAK